LHDLDARIERMYRRDRRIAIALVIVLVMTLGVVFAAIAAWASPEVRLALALAGSALVLFNGAAIGAMLRHNRADRRFIYTLDIKHLDEHRASRLQSTLQPDVS